MDIEPPAQSNDKTKDSEDDVDNRVDDTKGTEVPEPAEFTEIELEPPTEDSIRIEEPITDPIEEPLYDSTENLPPEYPKENSLSLSKSTTDSEDEDLVSIFSVSNILIQLVSVYIFFSLFYYPRYFRIHTFSELYIDITNPGYLFH